MRITADTNVLVRVLVQDDEQQSKIAGAVLRKAELVAIAVASLCELVWVLSQGYKVSSHKISEAIRLLIDSTNVVVNRPAVEAGLAMLEAGGDFADGAIAYEGKWLGSNTFVSFDKRAIKLIEAQGQSTRLLA